METLPRELVLDIYDIYKAGLKKRWFNRKVKLMDVILKFPFITFRHRGQYFYRCGIHRWRMHYELFGLGLSVLYIRIYSHSYHMETNRLEFVTPSLILYQ